MIAISFVFDRLWSQNTVNDLIAIRSQSRQSLLCNPVSGNCHISFFCYDWHVSYLYVKTTITNALMNRVRISIRTTLSSKYAPPAIQRHSTVKASATNQSHGLSGNKSSREEYMREWKFQRTKVLGPIHSRERMFQEAKVPRSKSSRERIDQDPVGTFAPGIELAWERKGSV